ncbi:MAG: ABC transporter permease [candidate division Zixibacteria bacterium]|nr:ABC transporter permease [candidate division Zixibacteria bacterium]
MRTVRTAGWLGWQIEANWAEPFTFIAYAITRPIFSTLILVLMYKVVAGGQTSTPLFAYIYLGNAFFMYTANVLAGVGIVIHEDRERYEMLKYIYLAPIVTYFYMLGRCIPKLIITTLAVLVTVVMGVWIFDLKLTFGHWPLMILSFPLGIIATIALGIALASLTLLTARHGFFMTEGTAGIFYLVSGAVFPIEVLPDWLEPAALAFPITYWLEGLRRGMMAEPVSKIFVGWSDEKLLLILALTTALSVVLSVIINRGIEYIARKQGKLDQVFNY